LTLIAAGGVGEPTNGVLSHLEARDITTICISHAPVEKLLAYRRRMGWSFNWASSYESDFNFDFGVSLADEAAHVALPLLEANEVAAFPLMPRSRGSRCWSKGTGRRTVHAAVDVESHLSAPSPYRIAGVKRGSSPVAPAFATALPSLRRASSSTYGNSARRLRAASRASLPGRSAVAPVV
jgi:hypothetical protein